MNRLKALDLNRTFRTIVVLVAVILVLLVTLAVGIVVEGERRLRPLQDNTEALSEAESHLIALIDIGDPARVPQSPPDAAASPASIDDNVLLDAVEQLSHQVRKNLRDLESAQDDYMSLTHFAAGGIVLLVLMLGALTLLFRHRVLRPISALSGVLRRLALRDYSPQSLHGIDSMLHPIFESYNSLVNRLARLEQAHESRHEEMERRVEVAVGALVAQRAHLARAERLAAIGEMAAMLAHEIRNPLASIRAACSSLLEEATDDDVQERLELVIQEVDRLVAIVGQQLDHARHRPEPSEPTDVADLITNTAKLLAYQLPAEIRIRLALASALQANLPPEGLRRSLLNLVLNAKHAIEPNPGEIVIGAEADATEMRITVADNGPGFPAALLEQGARRFVTTRTGGTGLGLSMIRRYVEQLSGRLLIENGAEGGARVTMVLPRQLATHDEIA